MNYKEFEQLAIPQKTYLYNYAFYITKNSEDAMDLMQETYLKAYRFRSYFDGGSNVKAWLYRIMKNSYINLYRKEIREPKKVEYQEYHAPSHTTQELSADQRNRFGMPYKELFGDEIVRSIDSLADTFRNVVLLSDMEGLSYQEIAQVIDCPIGTVRSRLYRGRKLLQKKLFTYAKENGYIDSGSCIKRYHETPHSGNKSKMFFKKD
jgi:RNA polymerase sigma-70 factor, ECF subfamily